MTQQTQQTTNFSNSLPEAMSYFERKKGYFYEWKPVLHPGYKLQNVTYTNIINFCHRWAFKSSLINDTAAYSIWTVRDHESMFSISDTLYGSVYHFWIVMMMNNIIDPFYGWVLSNDELWQYVIRKYGIENIGKLHHYESANSADIGALPEGIIVSKDYGYPKVAISNYEFEDRLNHEKRKIKLLKPEMLDSVLKEKESIVTSDFQDIQRL